MVDASGHIVARNRAYDSEFGAGPLPVPKRTAPGTLCRKAEWPQVRAAAGENFLVSFTRVHPETRERRWYEATGGGAGGNTGGGGR